MIFLIMCLAGFATAFSFICIFEQANKMIKEAWRLRKDVKELEKEITTLRRRNHFRKKYRKTKKFSVI